MPAFTSRKRSPDGASSDWGCGRLIAVYYLVIYTERMKGWVLLTYLGCASCPRGRFDVVPGRQYSEWSVSDSNSDICSCYLADLVEFVFSTKSTRRRRSTETDRYTAARLHTKLLLSSQPVRPDRSSCPSPRCSWEDLDERNIKRFNVKVNTCYSAAYMSQTPNQQRFTISEVAADWHEPTVPLCIMWWPSIAGANGQLDPRCS